VFLNLNLFILVIVVIIIFPVMGSLLWVDKTKLKFLGLYKMNILFLKLFNKKSGFRSHCKKDFRGNQPLPYINALIVHRNNFYVRAFWVSILNKLLKSMKGG